MIDHQGKTYIIDTGQDFRAQALNADLQNLDAVFYTHDHADHLLGIDDLRVFTFYDPMPVYGSPKILEQIRERFSYMFNSDMPGGGVASLDLRIIPVEGVSLEGLLIRPIPIYHGKKLINGYRFGNTAYLTDCSGIPEESLSLLEGLDTLIIGALRYTRHPTHYSVDEAVAAIKKIAPKRAYLTHMCHNLEHDRLLAELPESIEPACDGLRIRCS